MSKQFKSQAASVINCLKKIDGVACIVIAVGFFTRLDELHNQVELHEILVSNLIKHGATSVKESAMAADIRPITKNIHPISNCAEILAERFVER